MNKYDYCASYTRAEFDKLFRTFGKQVNSRMWRPMEYSAWKRLDNFLKSVNDKVMFSIGCRDGEVEIYSKNFEMLLEEDCGFAQFLCEEIIYAEEVESCWDEEDNLDKNMKENEDMKGFNFDFGPCTNDGIKMSMYGIALRNAAGTYVSYDKKSGDIIDVDCLNFDGGQFLFKMPVAVKDIKIGDVVIHNKTAMFVTSVENGVSVVDIRAGEIKTIIPTKSMFGFDFITKIVSMFDAVSGAPSPSEPFGNMLPFLMMQDGKMDTNTMMAMMMMNGKTDFASNPMMLYLLMGKDSKDSLLPLAFMMNNNKEVK
jgi:hypothetical protein